MKHIKLLFLTIFTFIGLNASSQVFTSFNLYIDNASPCPYTIVGSYYGGGIQGTISFNQQPSGNYYIGILPGVDSLTLSICVISEAPCEITQCIDTVLYMGAGQQVSTFNIQIPWVSSVTEELTNNIKTWPNPVSGIFSINTPSNSGTIKIYAIDGSCVYENNYFNKTIKMNSDILVEGTYVITLIDDNGMFYTTKIIK